MLKNTIITGFADEIHEDLAVQIKLLQTLGMNYLEFRSANGKNIGDYTIAEAKEVKKYLEDQNIKVSAIGSPIGKIKITDDFKNHFEMYKRVVEITHLFETPYIRMFSFFMPEGEAPEIYKEEVFDRIGQFIDYAKGNEVILLHENEKDIYGDVPLRCQQLFQTFYCDNFKGVFDFANFVQCKQDTMEAFQILEPFIAYIHIKDALLQTGEVVPAGKGDGHVADILNKLNKNNYAGFLSLEPHLTNFSGLNSLEKSAEKKALSNQEEAFALAYHSLMSILNEME